MAHMTDRFMAGEITREIVYKVHRKSGLLDASDTELIAGAHQFPAVEDQLQQFLALHLPPRLILQRAHDLPGVRVDHIAGRRIRESSIDAERDPAGHVADL